MEEIIVVGLGPGSHEHLTREAWRYLKSDRSKYFLTLKHPAARYFAGGKNDHTFDPLYIPGIDRRRVCRIICSYLLKAARSYGTICFAVPGHPLTGEETVQQLIKRAPRQGVKIKIVAPPYQGYLVGDLLEIMDRLRSENGCPWDKQQTNRSLRQYLIEEAYEVIAAIDEQDDESLKEELGDVLLQVIFHSSIAEDENRFDFSQVVNGIATKLIRRHPHVFGKDKAVNASEVKALWEQIKTDERNNQNENKSHDSFSIDHALPALLKAYKLQKKAADMGFDWPCMQGPLQKAREELAELEEACRAENQDSIEEELGDFIFTIVNIARFLNVNPELALGKSISKFLQRFRYVLSQAEKEGFPASHFSLEKLDSWWEEAKKNKKMR